MPQITDIPPKFVAQELQALKTDLSQIIPPKKLDNNILIATWNIRCFSDATEKWSLLMKSIEQICELSPLLL